MDDYSNEESALVPVGLSGLQRISNSLRITNKLIQSGKIESVIIGTQEWMLRNLDVSTFRNGDLIHEVKGMVEWLEAGEEGIPAWCYYENNPDNGKLYGKLYNWHAVNDTRGLAPDGWRISSKADFLILIDAFGGVEVAGKKMKASVDKPNIPPYETTDDFSFGDDDLSEDERLQTLFLKIVDKVEQWDIHYKEVTEFKLGTNESGFGAYLAGYRLDSEVNGWFVDFIKLDLVTLFWCRDGEENNEAGCVSLDCASDDVGLSSASKVYGYSVRCIRDTTK
jgi:uncharacterized protein (TIGR02145 family)